LEHIDFKLGQTYRIEATDLVTILKGEQGTFECELVQAQPFNVVMNDRNGLVSQVPNGSPRTYWLITKKEIVPLARVATAGGKT
jgi:hypothetical protein